MQRSPGKIVFVALAIVAAVILAGTANRIAQVADAHTNHLGVQVVRGHYSALNDFLAHGQAEALTTNKESAFDGRYESQKTAEQDVEHLIQLSALRSTYPEMQYRIVDIQVIGDTVVANIETDIGLGKLPGWIEVNSRGERSSSSVSFQLDNDKIVEQTGTSGQLVAFIDLVNPDTDFLLGADGRLTMAELQISTNDKLVLPLPGPGVFVVTAGSIEVIGNGMAEIVELRTAKRTVVPVGVQLVAERGDAIVVRAARTIVRVEGGEPVTVLASVVAPVGQDAPSHIDREYHHSLKAASTLPEILRARTEGVQETWFGSVEILGTGPIELQAGAITLCAGWLVIPGGDMVSIAPRQGDIVVSSPEQTVDVAPSDDSAQWIVSNHGSEPALVFVTRAGTINDF